MCIIGIIKYLENKLMCFELQGIDYQDEAVQTLTEESATEDEKLLKEMGIEDPIGTPTTLGFDLSDEINYKKNRRWLLSVIHYNTIKYIEYSVIRYRCV